MNFSKTSGIAHLRLRLVWEVNFYTQLWPQKLRVPCPSKVPFLLWLELWRVPNSAMKKSHCWLNRNSHKWSQQLCILHHHQLSICLFYLPCVIANTDLSCPQSQNDEFRLSLFRGNHHGVHDLCILTIHHKVVATAQRASKLWISLAALVRNPPKKSALKTNH